MKNLTRKTAMLFLAISATALLGTGCEDGSSGPDPVGADIAGSWSGIYTRPGHTENITAQITQNASNVVITTQFKGNVHEFTGIIREDTRMYMWDSYDGEEWTTLGDVTDSYLYLRDNLNEEWDGTGELPVQRMHLSR